MVAREAFLAHITINVTEFYRNKELFDAFEKTLLTKIVPQFALPKIWSAACSIGAEPYTIAMLLEKKSLGSARCFSNGYRSADFDKRQNKGCIASTS